MTTVVEELRGQRPPTIGPAPSTVERQSAGSRRGRIRLLARIERWYGFARSLSFDVTLAALAGGVMAARLLHVHPAPAFYLLLPAGAWAAYTFDHLLDAHRVGPHAHTPRHRLHHRHARLLWALLAAVAVLAPPVGAIALSRTGLLFGMLLAVLCVAHEALVKLAGSRVSPLLVKEFGVGVIFTAATWGLPIMLHARLHAALPPGPALAAFQYLLLALVNLLELSTYEAAADARDGHASFVQAVGSHAAQRTSAALLVSQLLVGIAVVILAPTRETVAAEAVFTAMTALLAIVLRSPRFLRKRERYRVLADGAFLLPLLMLVH